MDLAQPRDLIQKMHEIGEATKELQAKSSHASGAVIGGAATPPPQAYTPTPSS